MMNVLKKNPIYIAFAGSFVLFLSLFFPIIEKEIFWVRQNANLLSLDGKWMLLLLFLALVFIIYKKEKYALISYIGILLLFIKDVKAVLPTFKPNQLLQSFSYGAGFYLFILGLVIIALFYIFTFFYLKSERKTTKKKHLVRKHHPIKKHRKQESK